MVSTSSHFVVPCSHIEPEFIMLDMVKSFQLSVDDSPNKVGKVDRVVEARDPTARVT